MTQAEDLRSGTDVERCGACVGGVDEAGRGPLAGPVMAAVVVLAPRQRIAGVRDSKQLTAARRAELFDIVRCEARHWAIGRADVGEIDELNILHATMLAMRRAVEGLPALPGVLRIDGNRAPEIPGYAGTTETVVGGDRSCQAIGAASILAKVARDRVMRDLATRFPGYGFARNKGYPTAEHRDALLRLGPCPVHRRSFRPVRDALAAHGGKR